MKFRVLSVSVYKGTLPKLGVTTISGARLGPDVDIVLHFRIESRQLARSSGRRT